MLAFSCRGSSCLQRQAAPRLSARHTSNAQCVRLSRAASPSPGYASSSNRTPYGIIISRSRLTPALALEANSQSATETQCLEELNQENFYPYLESQGDTLVVVDFYTNYCGPCKVMLPELYKLQDEMPHIRIVKFNCNKQNRDLGKALNIRVAPTFHLYKRSTKVGEMTGAKIDKLRKLVDSALSQN